MEWLPGIDAIGRQLITSILTYTGMGIAGGIVRAVFSDFFDFALPRFTDVGHGGAGTVYIYNGKVYLDGKLKDIELPKELSDDKHDAHHYEFVDVEFKVNRSWQVRLRATMKYGEGGRRREARVWGRGEYMRMGAEPKDGHAAISCHFREEGMNREWTATYFLRATPDGLWKGYWFLLDREQPETTNFGMMEFKTERKRWFSRLFRGRTAKASGGAATTAPAT